eukprot:TRINITY_DN5633_c0_g3_i1.p1 TRINITY_DN5633_c0_g3~~TRINITY_DN5633_c0_g3_i1.p1  ORF type:complete len:391 (-),score=80.29 TRINITY_DN5633_c0_g3_i1:49-1221(-)
MESQECLVLDSGVGYMKAGFGGDEAPRVVFPSVLGTPFDAPILPRAPLVVTSIGDEALKKFTSNESFKLSRPFDSTVMRRDWGGMTSVWHHTFYNELKVAPEDYGVLLASCPPTEVGSTCEIMFEKFNAREVNVHYTAAQLALFDSGRLTGLVVDSGFKSTSVCPVIEGRQITSNISNTSRIAIGGESVTDCILAGLGAELEAAFNKGSRQIADAIKHELAFVSPSVGETEDNKSVESSMYVLPDGKTVSIGNERCMGSEKLFEKLPEAVMKVVSKCDERWMSTLLKNIVVVGGNSMLPGFGQRLSKDLKNHLMVARPPNDMEQHQQEVKVISAPQRKYSVWVGGSIICDMRPSLSDGWITKQAYDEEHPPDARGRLHRGNMIRLQRRLS